MRYKFLVLFVFLPLLTQSKNARPRRRPFLEPNASTQYPLLDQLALADNTWETPNKIISASYRGDPDTGHVDHANLVINVLPQNKKPAEVDVVASQALANAKTAEEYVSKAMEMRNKYDYTTPSSSFVKYDIFENVETKHMSTPASQIEIPLSKKSTTEVSKKSSLDYDLDDYRRPDYLKQFSWKEHDSSFGNFHDAYDAYENFQDDKSQLFTKKLPPPISNYPTKDEVFRQIEKSVLKYMRELEADGKISIPNNRPTAHTEIKTYYRFPAATVPSPSQSQSSNIVNTGTHSEFFKPVKHGSHGKGKYSTIKPFSADTYLPETVDLTFPSNKKRPKPLDLAALDVGQTWLHGTETHVPSRKPPKSKLHFNSQAYQDINSLSFPPNKGLFDDNNAAYSSQWLDQVNSQSTSLNQLNKGSANVGASISFGGDQDAFGSEDTSKVVTGQYIPSMQVINGVPVANPYKFQMDSLNDAYENGILNKPLFASEHSYGDGWSPLNAGVDSSNAIRDSYHPLYNNMNNLPYDSYSPKFNNYHVDEFNWNKGNRQRGSLGHVDMFSSSTSNRPKKVVMVAAKGNPKRLPPKQKVKAKPRIGKRPPNPTTRERDPDLSRELSPPPPEGAHKI